MLKRDGAQQARSIDERSFWLGATAAIAVLFVLELWIRAGGA